MKVISQENVIQTETRNKMKTPEPKNKNRSESKSKEIACQTENTVLKGWDWLQTTDKYSQTDVLICDDIDATICSQTNVNFTASGANLYEFFIDGVSQGVQPWCQSRSF